MTSGPEVALVAAIAFALGFLAERALLRWRLTPYFTLGFPLAPPLLPIPTPPEGQGRTASVRWEAIQDGEIVRWWAEPRASNAPTGLHGAVLVQPIGRGASRRYALTVRWAPLWTPLFAFGWLGGLGLSRGQGMITVPLATALALVMLGFYHRAALRAAAELRWSFVR